MRKKTKLLLLIPALWASLFDILITITHQSKGYWDGDLSQADEGNPVGALLMKHHVAGLFVISIFWIIIIGLLGYFLPQRVGKTFLLFCLIAHSYGASTWLSSRYGFWYVISYILFNSILYSLIDIWSSNKLIHPNLLVNKTATTNKSGD